MVSAAVAEEWDSPNNSEREGRVNMNEQRRDLVLVVKYKTVSPCDDGTSQGTMGKTVARDEQDGAAWEEPEVDEVEDGDIVAQVEEEVVPGALLVLVISERQKIEPLHGVRNVHPSNRQSVTRLDRDAR